MVATVRYNDRGDYVRFLQEELGVTADGIFGAETGASARISLSLLSASVRMISSLLALSANIPEDTLPDGGRGCWTEDMGCIAVEEDGYMYGGQNRLYNHTDQSPSHQCPADTLRPPCWILP